MGGVEGGGETVTADRGDDGGDDEQEAEALLLDLLKSSGLVLRFSGSSENKKENIVSNVI